MIELLFVTILINFAYGLKGYKSWANPIIVFTLGFLISSVVCLLYKEEWRLSSFHLNTYFVIGGGISFFSFICYLTNIRYKNHYNITQIEPYNYDVKKTWMLYLIIANFATQLLVYRAILSYAGGSTNIGDALSIVDKEFKYSETDFKLPFILTNFRFLFECISYYFMLLAARKIVDRKINKTFILYLLYIVITFFGNFLSGSRNGSMSMFTYFAVCIFIISTKRNRLKPKFSLNKLTKYLIISIASIAIFIKSTEWVGRDYSDFGPLYYFSFYCGAEIKNLDTYLNENHKQSENFGEFTLKNKNDKTDAIATKITPFRWEGNYMLGNVYTTFLNYCQDFGIIGSFICVGIMAFIMQLFYIRALKSPKLSFSMFDFNIYIYAYLCKALFMSFFAERFYSTFDKGFIKSLIEIMIFSFIISKYGKLVYKKNN